MPGYVLSLTTMDYPGLEPGQSLGVKATCYKALVRPHLEYTSSATVWDPYTIKGIQAVESVQRRAAWTGPARPQQKAPEQQPAGRATGPTNKAGLGRRAAAKFSLSVGAGTASSGRRPTQAPERLAASSHR
ncbi:hypothetical protein Bbelb_080000 [Branchiostoma belcheri]|nr:hypothetical protein Bbelb_080000 [Branchiostoma belcheri]